MSQIKQIADRANDIASASNTLPARVRQSLADAQRTNPRNPDLRPMSQLRISAIGAINELRKSPHMPELLSLVSDVRQRVDRLVNDTGNGLACIERRMPDADITRCGWPDRQGVTSNLTRLGRVLSVLRQGPSSSCFYQSLNLGNLSKGFVAGALLGVGGILGPGLLESFNKYLANRETPAQPTTLVSENPSAEKPAAVLPPANEDANQRVNRGIRELRDNARNNVRGKQRTAPEHDPNHTSTEIPTKPDPQTPLRSTIIR